MIKDDILIILPNPHHGEDIGVKLLSQILKEAGIDREKWLSLE
jgi:predicted RNA binding protein YcfA (HicA-like mRNA interferase family)